MNNQNKALALFVALVAFAVGMVLNTSRTEAVSEASALLSAELETYDARTDTSGTGTTADHLGELTLVNFWATWCSPCREEMPVFETMYRLHKPKGFNVVGVAIDSPSRAQPFLESMDISYPILYAEKTGMQLLEKTGNAQGLLPYSLLLDKNGKVLDQVLGKIDEAQIAAWLDANL